MAVTSVTAASSSGEFNAGRLYPTLAENKHLQERQHFNRVSWVTAKLAVQLLLSSRGSLAGKP
jgi:hypothetical protein